MTTNRDLFLQGTACQLDSQVRQLDGFLRNLSGTIQATRVLCEETVHRLDESLNRLRLAASLSTELREAFSSTAKAELTTTSNTSTITGKIEEGQSATPGPSGPRTVEALSKKTPEAAQAAISSTRQSKALTVSKSRRQRIRADLLSTAKRLKKRIVRNRKTKVTRVLDRMTGKRRKLTAIT